MADYLRESGVKWIWEKIKTLLSAKQDKLVSGTNIKTINGTSLLGSGDVTVSGGSGGDFDSSGSYPNLTAGKATKLATGRTIALSGGATGTATSFDGSKNVSIPVTSIYDSYVSWGGKLIANNMSPLDATSPMFSANRLAFFPPEKMSVEYSNDGGATWLDYGASNIAKNQFLNFELGGAIFNLGKTKPITPNDMVRVSFDFSGTGIYFKLSKLLLNLTNVASTSKKTYIEIKTETHARDTAASVIKTYEYKYLVGYSGWNSIPLTNILIGSNVRNDVVRKLTITLKSEIDNTVSPAFYSIYVIGNTDYSSRRGYNRAGHLYDYDWQQNATFPAQVKGKKLITDGGTANQVVLGNGNLKEISELSPITDADAEILLDNHIHSINVNANGNNVNISVIESSKNGNTWETEDNDITIPLATTTSAGVMSKEDKALLNTHTTKIQSAEDNITDLVERTDAIDEQIVNLDDQASAAASSISSLNTRVSTLEGASGGSNIGIDADSGIPDFIGDFDYSSVDYEAIIDLTTVDWINWVEGGLYLMNAEETWEEDNGDTSYHQCVVTFIYRANGCIPLSIVNTNKMTAKMSGMVITINLTEGTGELRFKQIKLI